MVVGPITTDPIKRGEYLITVIYDEECYVSVRVNDLDKLDLALKQIKYAIQSERANRPKLRYSEPGLQIYM